MNDGTESERVEPNRNTWNVGNPELDEASQWLANLRSLFLEAETLNFSYREEEALRLYNRLVQQDADSLYGHLAAGQIAISHGSTESALDEFLLAKQVEGELLRTGILDNKVDSTSIHLGLTYRKLRKFEEAIEALASVNPPERQHPNPFAYAAQASVYRAILTDANHNRLPNAEQESVRKRIEHFASLALSIDPKLSYAQSILVKLYQEQGHQDTKQLNTAYRLALDIVRAEPENWYVLGLLGDMRAKEAPAEAIDFYLRSVRACPRKEIYSRFGLARLVKGGNNPDLPLARQLFQEILAVVPTHTGALSGLADVLFRQGEVVMAEEKLRQALEQLVGEEPERQVYSRVLLGKILLAQGQVRAARDVISSVNHLGRNSALRIVQAKLAQEKERAPVLKRQAEEQDRKGMREDSLDLYRQVLDRDPECFVCYARIARLLMLQEDYKGAIWICQEALRAGEAEGYSEKLMADAQHRLGNNAKALLNYGIALRKNDALPRDSRDRFSLDISRFVSSQIRTLSAEVRDARAAERARQEAQRRSATTDGVHFTFSNTSNGDLETHSYALIRDFLPYILKKELLPIGQGNPSPISQIGIEPTFLVAKTGVGKTVTVPTKVLIAQCDRFLSGRPMRGSQKFERFPQVYVVVPRIPIAESQMSFMNSVYQGYLAEQGIHTPHRYNLYGSISSLGKKNANAPVVFVTTGIFESMVFGSRMDPEYTRIIIDEAHVTIEQNPGVEIGIAIARASNVIIDYMSATVDTAGLQQDLDVKILTAGTIRYPIMLTNLGGRLEQHLVDVVRNYLVAPDEALFPDRSDPDYGQVTRDLFDNRNRPRGMLIIVNSHQGASSDTTKYCEMLEEADFNTSTRKKVSVFSYAAPVARDRASEEHFKAQIAAVEARNGLYVIVSTNVVEMGVTFDSLDYVITMDSEFVTTFVDGGQVLETGPLGVNALYQRIGRVGRKRAGIAFIAREFGAPYTDLTDTEIRQGLSCQPIRYPIAKGNLQKLALLSFSQQWSDPEAGLRALRLPSMRTSSAEVLQRFKKERFKLERLGLASGSELTDIGKRSLDFVSVENLNYKRMLALAERQPDTDLLLVTLVLAGAADMTLNSFLLSGTRFDTNEETGIKEGLRLSRFLKLNCSTVTPEELVDILDSSGTDGLLERLYHCGVSRCDAVLIQRYLDHGFHVVSVEREGGEASTCIEATLGIMFDKIAVLADPDADAVTIYRIVSHFYNNYLAFAQLPSTSHSRQMQVYAAFEQEALELGLNPRAIKSAAKGMRNAMRQVGRKGEEPLLSVSRVGRRPADQQPSPIVRFDGLYAELMLNVLRQGWQDVTDEAIDALTAELCEAATHWRKAPEDAELSRLVQNCFEQIECTLGGTGVRGFIAQVVRPALRYWHDEMQHLEFTHVPDKLPVMTEGLRRAFLHFISRIGFGDIVELTFMQEEPFYKMWVGSRLSETGSHLPIVLRPGATSLHLPEQAITPLRIRGQLLPGFMFGADDASGSGSTQAGGGEGKRRIFELSHVSKCD